MKFIESIQRSVQEAFVVLAACAAAAACNAGDPRDPSQRLEPPDSLVGATYVGTWTDDDGGSGELTVEFVDGSRAETLVVGSPCVKDEWTVGRYEYDGSGTLTAEVAGMQVQAVARGALIEGRYAGACGIHSGVVNLEVGDGSTVGTRGATGQDRTAHAVHGLVLDLDSGGVSRFEVTVR